MSETPNPAFAVTVCDRLDLPGGIMIRQAEYGSAYGLSEAIWEVVRPPEGIECVSHFLSPAGEWVGPGAAAVEGSSFITREEAELAYATWLLSHSG